MIPVEIVEGNALRFPADVLAVKYAGGLHGVDRAVADAVRPRHPDLARMLPEKGSVLLLSGGGSVAARSVLYVGMPPLGMLDYGDVRDFGRRALAALAAEAPETTHLAVTLHGVGFGLDEREALESELLGFEDAARQGEIPSGLGRITIVEQSSSRVERLRGLVRPVALSKRAPLQAPAKPHVFVAMPFAESMDDVFHYGIQSVVNAAGYLCERADQASFTGDILDWIKKRIETATVVIADLTTANPNVYLEVGYAWGCRKRTVLVVQKVEDLKFDLRGQKCLVYTNIKSLEGMLRKELAALSGTAN